MSENGRSAASGMNWLRRAAATVAPLVVAHRGASALAPENTLAAFTLAIDHGAAAVECDVHLSADGVPVIIHDSTLDRTTDGAGEVAAHRFHELRALDAGRWMNRRFLGERLPSLDEALAACAGRARLFVELKRGGGDALVDASLAAIGRATGTDVAVIGFGPEEVRAVARRRPDLPLGFLVTRQHVRQHGSAAAIELTASLGATFFCPQHDAVDANLVGLAHDRDLPVSVWTVDDPARMRELAAIGVDAITTNRPEVALATFR